MRKRRCLAITDVDRDSSARENGIQLNLEAGVIIGQPVGVVHK